MDFRGLELNSREPVYLQIAAYVKRQIFLGTVQTGVPLPSRREIAAQLEVNPNTVQKAFRLMESEGFVMTSGNTGSIILADERIRARIADELTRGFISEFVRRAKENRLSLPRVISLLGELWDA